MAHVFMNKRFIHGHLMFVNKSECTYKTSYAANSGYAFKTGKDSFHSSPDVCEGICCPFNRQSVNIIGKKVRTT